jgi:hypothetical protein
VFKRFRTASALVFLVGFGLACAVQVRAATGVDTLAQDVDRLASLREVKDLQRSYAQ